MPDANNCDSAHNLDSEINSGSCSKRRLLAVRLHCFLGLGVEKSDSFCGDLHAMSPLVSPCLRVECFFHTIHIVELQLYDLVVSRVASWCANDLVNSVLLESWHLFGHWNVILPVLFVELFRVFGFAKQHDDLRQGSLASRSWLLWSRFS